MTPLINVEDLGPQTTYHNATLYRVVDLGRHKLLPAKRPTERWTFEVEIKPGYWELVDCHFPKWRHPYSARTKFLTRWLSEELRPAMLTKPWLLLGLTARVKIRTSIDSDGFMERVVVSAWPNPDPVDSPGRCPQIDTARLT